MATENKQTVKQFKAWIEGVEEMQKADWHPSKEQWAKIRDKIDALGEEPYPSSTPLDGPLRAELELGPSHGTGRMMAPATTSALANAEIVDTGVDEHTPVPEVPMEEPVTSVNALTPEMTTLDGKPVVKSKTPNIDTSDKDYSSPYA